MSPDDRAPGTMSHARMERRIRTAGLLVALGLVLEAGSLLWHHPLSFVFFAATGPILILGGIGFYLLSLVHRDNGVSPPK